MALESPTVAQPTVSPSQSEAGSPVAPALKPTRARNEYPEAYDELEELERTHTPKSEKPAAKPTTDKSSNGKPPSATPKPAEKTAAKVDDAPAAKPSVKPDDKSPAKPTEKPDSEPADDESDPSAKYQLAHDLRKAYRQLHKSVSEKDKELTELRGKIEKAPVNNAILEENKAIKKRLEEVESELRYVDYTKSQEFKEKFEKPYQDAYDDAVEEVKELRVSTPDGQSRPATAQDFQRILQADTQDVRALANEMFGEAANDVLAARRRLVELNRTANRESKRYREQAAERERQKSLKAVEEREQMEHLWNKAVESIAEKYPDYFKHREGDDEYNKELDAGYATVDRAHAANLPLEEKVARLAALRHRAAAFRPLVLERNRLKERIAELEGIVAEYEKSVPQGGRGGSETGRVPTGEESGDGYPNAMEEIDALAAKDTTTD